MGVAEASGHGLELVQDVVNLVVLLSLLRAWRLVFLLRLRMDLIMALY